MKMQTCILNADVWIPLNTADDPFRNACSPLHAAPFCGGDHCFPCNQITRVADIFLHSIRSSSVLPSPSVAQPQTSCPSAEQQRCGLAGHVSVCAALAVSLCVLFGFEVRHAECLSVDYHLD